MENEAKPVRRLNIQAKTLQLAEIELLDRNAHYMPPDVFKRLVENVRRDGTLTSTPFCWLTPEGRYRVLSGNHRVKAGIKAGIVEAVCLCCDDDLTPDEQMAIQLSHNAIVGKDDPAMLAQLYSEVTSVELKLYTGLDDKLLDLLKTAPQMDSFGEPDLNWQTFTFMFLPEEADALRRAFEQADKLCRGERFAATFDQYRPFMDALSRVQGAADIRNVACAMALALQVWDRHAQDLADLFCDEDGNAKHSRWVDLDTVLARRNVPTATAAKLRKSVARLVKAGKLPADKPWQWFDLAIAAVDSAEA